MPENKITPIEPCNHARRDAIIFPDGNPLVFRGAFFQGKIDPEVEQQIRNQFGQVRIIPGPYTHDTLTLGG